MRYRALAVLLVATFGVAYAKQALLENVPLQWKPTSQLRLGTVQMSQASVHFVPFKDARQDVKSIGQNLEDEDKPPKPVTTNDDVGAFVSTHMSELFKQAGFSVVDSGATVTIQGEVTQFFVRETNTYQSTVTVHLTVLGAGGQKLWSGTASGDASRFGRSYKLENYYETLSDALVNATSSALESPDIQKALSGR